MVSAKILDFNKAKAERDLVIPDINEGITWHQINYDQPIADPMDVTLTILDADGCTITLSGVEDDE